MPCFRGTHEQQVPRTQLSEWGASDSTHGAARGSLSPGPAQGDHPQPGLLAYRWPEAIWKSHCSKGTYIRQLAADIGKTLQCGAYVNQLRRLASGPFVIAQAVSLDGLRGGSGKSLLAGASHQHEPGPGPFAVDPIDAPERSSGYRMGKWTQGWRVSSNSALPGKPTPFAWRPATMNSWPCGGPVRMVKNSVICVSLERTPEITRYCHKTKEDEPW